MSSNTRSSDVLSTGALPLPESDLKKHTSNKQPKGSKKGLLMLIIAATLTVSATIAAGFIFLTNLGGLQTYTNNNPQFSFGYPEGWQTEQSGNQIFITPEPISQQTDSFSPEIIVSVINEPGITSQSDFEQLYPAIIEAYAKAQGEDYTLRTSSQTTVANMPAFLVVADSKGNDDLALQHIQYDVYYNDQILSFLFITDEANKQLVDVFERGVNKLK